MRLAQILAAFAAIAYAISCFPQVIFEPPVFRAPVEPSPARPLSPVAPLMPFGTSPDSPGGNTHRHDWRMDLSLLEIAEPKDLNALRGVIDGQWPASIHPSPPGSTDAQETASVNKPSLAETDPFFVRIEIGGEADKTAKITTETALTEWAIDNHVAVVFQDGGRGKLIDILKRHLNTDDPKVLHAAITLNYPYQRRDFRPDRKLLFLAPLGSLKHDDTEKVESKLPLLVQYKKENIANIKELLFSVPFAKEYAQVILRSPDDIPGPSYQLLELPLTRATTRSLKSDAVRFQIVSGKFILHQATSNQKTSFSSPSNDEILLRSLFARGRSSIRPLVIILDDSWPSENEYTITREFINSIAPDLWNSTLDSVKHPPPPNFQNPYTNAGPPTHSGCQTLETCDTHAKRIWTALNPYRQLAHTSLGQEPVDVIYIPYTKAQHGAIEILRTLWNLQYFSGYRGTGVATDAENNFIAGIPEKFTGTDVSTDYGILYAVFSFAARYARYRQVPVFVSASWYSGDASTYSPPALNAANTLLVAAVAEDCQNDHCARFTIETRNVPEFVDSAKRSPNDVVVVMNLDEKGNPTCGSEKISTTQYSVVGFNGKIRGDCGTSYATPRVAWLFALNEAYYSSSTTFDNEMFNSLRWIFDSGKPKPLCKRDDDFPCTSLSVGGLLSRTEQKNHHRNKLTRGQR